MNDFALPSTITPSRRAQGRSLGDFRIDGATTPNGLWPAEENLLSFVRRGETCPVSELDWKKPEELEKLKSDEQFRIRAGFLRFLALGGDDSAPVHERGLWISQAYIDSDLDLEGCRPVAQLVIIDSYFAGSLNVRDAHLKGLCLNGSRVGEIEGDRARIDGSVLLRSGFLAEGAVRLLGADLGGSLECDGSSIRNAGATALLCDGTKISGSVFLRNEFSAEGEVRFVGADVRGTLEFDASTFKNPGGTALECAGVRVTGHVYMRNGFSAEGAVRLLGAQIGGDLACTQSNFKNAGAAAIVGDRARITGSVFLSDGCVFEGEVRLPATEIGGVLSCIKGSIKNLGGTALNCEGATIAGIVFLSNGFAPEGEVRFRGAQIGGTFECDASTFKKPGSVAIDCAGARVTGHVFMRNGFSAEGAVRLLGAQIAGDLDCSRGSFKNAGASALVCDRSRITGSVFLSDGCLTEGEVRLPAAEIGGILTCIKGNFKNAGGTALNCEGTKIAGIVFLSNGFAPEGEVRLRGAEIGGDLACDGSTFKNAGRTALNCEGVRIKGYLFLRQGFTAEGAVRLLGAEIGGDLDCSQGSFKNAGGTALNCSGIRVTRYVYLRDGMTADGTVDFSGAHTQNLIDDDLARGQAGPCTLVLDGFTYDRIAGAAPTDAKTRIGWLMRQRTDYISTDFRPQPFEQLAKVLAAMGHDSDARKVAVRKQRLMIPVRVARTAWPLKPVVWLLWHAHRWTSGFGYRPGRLIFMLLALWLVVGWFNYQAADAGVFAPADAQVWTNDKLVATCQANWTKCRDPAAPELPGFHPLTYSADVMLPLLDLGQRRVWAPMRKPFMLSLTPREWWVPDWVPIVQLHVPAWLPTWIVAFQNFLGSLGALLFGAIVTGLIKKD